MAGKICLVIVAFMIGYAYSDSSECEAERQGCYKHTSENEHILHSDTAEHKGESFHSGKEILWDKMETYLQTATCRCEEAAAKKNYKYFSLRHFGECHGLNSLAGMESSDYCFYHDNNMCKENYERCTGADEGEFVFEVKLKTSSAALPLKAAMFCEHRGARDIVCPSNHVINIKSGYYGRTSSAHCGHRSYYKLNCNAHQSFQMIKDVCNGRKACRLNPHNGVYGDPCPYTVKYLDVKYTCVPMPAGDAGAAVVKHTHFCEHRGARVVSCGTKKIKVRSAFYGRLAKICGSSSRFNYKCVASTSEAKIKAACDGKSSCHLNPHNGIYGDPCPYTVKYIKVSYSCVN